MVYVGQREVAFLDSNQDFGLNYLGSEDATTCHIIVLQNSRTKLTALAHLDSVKSKGLDRVCKKLCSENSNDEIIVHVFGGYEDENQTSEELSLKFFKYLIRSDFHFALGYCVIGQFNTSFGDETSKAKYPRPIIYGIAVQIDTGEIYPAEFPDHGPDGQLRHVRLSFRQFESYEEYHEAKDYLDEDFDEKSGIFTIKPFGFGRSPDLNFIAKASDKFILENMSTSPKVEPKHFCSEIRCAVKLILDHPNPEISLFKNNLPRKYEYSKSEQKWKQI